MDSVKTTPASNDFDSNRLFYIIKEFSFPRLAGTDGEKKAVKKAVEQFRDIGYDKNNIQLQTFEFSDFYSTTLIKLIMSINLIFNLILLLFSYIHPLLSVLFVIFMVIMVSLIIRGLRHPEKIGFWGEYFGNIYEATNVITKIPAKSVREEGAGNIIISAHLDSKSQTYKTYWRITFYKLWVFSSIALGFFYILFLIIVFGNLTRDFSLTLYGAWISVILISISNLFLMFLNTGNQSPGSLDNASGMAIVFELSSYFLKNPTNNFNLWFCQFSAEELGTMGSRIFVKNCGNKFTKGRVFQINFDMVSCKCSKKNVIEYFKSYGVIMRKKIAPLLSKYIEKSAKQEKLNIKGFHLSTGAHTDSVPFHIRNLDAIDITTKAAALYTHTIEDTPDKVDPKILHDTCRIIKTAILMFDDDYEILCKNNQIACDI